MTSVYIASAKWRVCFGGVVIVGHVLKKLFIPLYKVRKEKRQNTVKSVNCGGREMLVLLLYVQLTDTTNVLLYP